MNQFFRGGGLIFKTFLYQIVMSLLGIMMYTATNKNQFLFVLGQTMVMLFFFYILISQMYQAGFKTGEYDRSHSTLSSPVMGFLFAAIAFLPTFVLSLGTLMAPPCLADGSYGSGYVPFLLNKTFLQGMYIGVVQWIYPTSAGGSSEAVAIANGAAMNSQCLIHTLTVIPGVLLSGLGYLLGYLNFNKDKKKKEKNV